VNNQVLKP